MVAREDGHHREPEKLFFNLRKAKSKISAWTRGDLRPDQVAIIAKRLGVTDKDGRQTHPPRWRRVAQRADPRDSEAGR